MLCALFTLGLAAPRVRYYSRTSNPVRIWSRLANYIEATLEVGQNRRNCLMVEAHTLRYRVTGRASENTSVGFFSKPNHHTQVHPRKQRGTN